MKKKLDLNNVFAVIPYIVTLVTSILLFIKYMGNIGSQSIIIHLHVWLGLAFLVVITHRIGKSFNKK